MYMTLPAVADVLANPSSLSAENNTIFFFFARHSINKNQSYFGRLYARYALTAYHHRRVIVVGAIERLDIKSTQRDAKGRMQYFT